MKSLLKTLFFFLLLTQICFAQWVPQNSGTTQNLNKVQFVDANTGWAVGDSGTILHTTNAGITWEQKPSGTTMRLNDIVFINESYGLIVGGKGTEYYYGNVLLYTSDGGSNWVEQILDTALSLNAVFYLNENIGWVAGARFEYSDSSNDYNVFPVILKTTTGGSNWQYTSVAISNPLASGYRANDIFFIDGDIGYAVIGVAYMGNSYGSILKTTDGGENWAEQTAYSPNYKSIVFLNQGDGFAVGNSQGPLGLPRAKIAKTTDGGNEWSIQTPIEGTADLKDISISSGNVVTVVGLRFSYGGIIIRSADSANTWAVQEFGLISSLNGVSFIDDYTGWVVGSNGIILHTTNGGVTFIDNEPTQPKEFILEQNYPNPFNPSTTISWQSPVGGWQTIKVYDVLGNGIATLVDEFKPAGKFEVEFDGTRLASGIYFYQLRAGEYTSVKKMILLR